MAFDLPASPAVGDVFIDATSGAAYRWNGYAWIGGVTGVGLQSIKETRYVNPGSFTHTRDPKSTGFADIHVLGAQGGRVAVNNASNICIAGGGGCGAYTIKFKYALAPSCPVVVGNGVSGLVGQVSSFDTGITAAGGLAGGSTTCIPSASAAAAGGPGGAAGTTGDENYTGVTGSAAQYNAIGIVSPAVWVQIRGILRKAAPGTIITSAIAAAAGEAGAVVVVEYVNP